MQSGTRTYTAAVNPCLSDGESRGNISDHTLIRNQDSVQHPAKQHITDTAILDFFRCEVNSASTKTANTYRQTIAALTAFWNHNASCTHDLSENNLRAWLSFMFYSGYSVKTVSYYFDTLTALCNKAIRAGFSIDTNPLKQLKAELKQLHGFESDEAATIHNLQQLPVLTAAISHEKGEIAMYLACFLISLYERGISFERLAYLDKSQLCTLLPESQALADAFTDLKRKYVFPLDQSKRTVRQLTTELNKKLRFVMLYKGLKPSLQLDDTTLNMWINTALKCGVTPEEILGCIDRIPDGNLTLRFAIPKHITPDEIQQISALVASCLTGNPSQWHAMRLRPHVCPKDIFQRLEQHPNAGSLIESTFYPCEEIAARIGKKLVYQERPLIADVLFFRSKATDVLTLFRIIGDLAWCYRTGSAYSVIPDAEMMRFQQTIGIFTRDMEITPIGTHLLGPGSKVRIIGGPMAGYEGIVHRLISDTGLDSSTRVFQLMLLGTQGIEWTADVNERLIEAIE